MLFALLPGLVSAAHGGGVAGATQAALCSDATPAPHFEIRPWSFHLTQMFYWFLCAAAADACVKRLLPASARWFALHAAANALVVAFGARDVAAFFASPLCAMLSAHSSWVPSHLAFALHAYHLVAFTSLRGEDIAHHLIFAFPTLLLDFSWAWGRVVNVFLFWVTGLPGGITYVLLVLVKTGRMTPLREKQISAGLNTWLRAPGLVIFSTVVFAAELHGLTRVPAPAAFFCAVLAAVNGLFYGEQATRSFAKWASKAADAKQGGEIATGGSAKKDGSL